MVFCEEKECFVHLVKVASGLDSAIFAETEIQGQVKRAYASAAKQRILSSSLHYFFQKSLHVAKGLRNAIFLDKGSATLYGTLWEIAQGYFSDLFSQRVLFVGYSKINLGFISFLSRRGLSRFSLATEHGEQIVLEGVSVAGRVLLQRWTEFDWIVCAAKSEKFLIQGQMQGNPLIFDLSVPRNVDPSLQGGGQLWNMEQIHQKIEKGQRARPSDAIEPMIEAQIARLKFGVARESGKRDDIADIFHSCGK